MPIRVDGEVYVVGWTLGNVAFKRIDNGTERMNIDGSEYGTSVGVWNGDDTLWTRSGVGSVTTQAAHAGTYGLDTGVTDENDNVIFDNGSMIDVDGTYASLGFWIQPKAYPVGSQLRVAFLDSSNQIIGVTVRVDEYITAPDLDEWQPVLIPISDFQLTGNVQKLAFRPINTDGQQYFLDDIQLLPPSSSGGPYVFRVSAPAGKQYHLSMLVLMVSEPSSGWSHNTFASLSALTYGLLLRQRKLSTGEIIWKFNSRDNVDLFGRYHPQESFTFDDGQLLLGFMVKPGQSSVVITDDDVLEFVVRDDLSSIDSMRAYAHYGIETL